MNCVALLRARSSSFQGFVWPSVSQSNYHRKSKKLVLLRSINTGTGRGRSSNNPYLILGLPPSASFRTVQKVFAKLAFEHHPDTSNGDRGNANNVSADFVRIRQAFERIRDAKQSGMSWNTTRTEDDDDDDISNPTKYCWSETDFLNYFHRQTGVRLTSDQRRELVHLYRSRVKGAYYGGHSWELARRLVAEQDAYLRNMESGGPPRGRRGARHDHSSATFQAGSPESEASGTNNLRRKRRR